MAQRFHLDFTGCAGQPTRRQCLQFGDNRRRGRFQIDASAGYAGKRTSKISETVHLSRKHVSYGRFRSLGVQEAIGNSEASSYNILYRQGLKGSQGKERADCCGQSRSDPAVCKLGTGGGFDCKLKRVQDLTDAHPEHSRRKGPSRIGGGQYTSCLQFDRFLTVTESANRSDRLKVIRNRDAPAANITGPFEAENQSVPKHRRGNLDRTLTPRVDSNRSDTLTGGKRGCYVYKT